MNKVLLRLSKLIQKIQSRSKTLEDIMFKIFYTVIFTRIIRDDIPHHIITLLSNVCLSQYLIGRKWVCLVHTNPVSIFLLKLLTPFCSSKVDKSLKIYYLILVHALSTFWLLRKIRLGKIGILCNYFILQNQRP